MGEPQQLRELEQTAGNRKMKIVSAAEMREIDRATSERFGVPSLGADGECRFGGRPLCGCRLPAGRSASPFCAARAITVATDSWWPASWLKRGARCGLLLLCDPSELRGDAAQMFQRHGEGAACGERCACRGARGERVRVRRMPRRFFPPTLIVDAILGTGFRPPVSPLYAAAIAKMNAAAAAPIVAVDIPSGADADALRPARRRNLASGAGGRDRYFHCAASGARIFAELTGGPTVIAPIGSPPKRSFRNSGFI
jgi:ADP-dependent NAD(P)H-hydrate dehydratase / NAD(P)H-hydrate epimerase